jgi:hypothetical protein
VAFKTQTKKLVFLLILLFEGTVHLHHSFVSGLQDTNKKLVFLLILLFEGTVQGGSDKSGLLNLFLENLTAQLKIIRFYKTKKKFTDGHIENQDIQ